MLITNPPHFRRCINWLPGLDNVDNKSTVFWRLYRMALRTGRCGERFQCCLPAERKRINNVVLVCHKGYPALVFLLAKDASLPEPVGADPLSPQPWRISDIFGPSRVTGHPPSASLRFQNLRLSWVVLRRALEAPSHAS